MKGEGLEQRGWKEDCLGKGEGLEQRGREWEGRVLGKEARKYVIGRGNCITVRAGNPIVEKTWMKRQI